MVKGGAHVIYNKQRAQLASHFDIAIIMTGGNDLVGRSPESVAESIKELSIMLLNVGVKAVLVMSFQPRASQDYNLKAKYLNELLFNSFPVSQFRESGILFWFWDRRIPKALCDGTHMYPVGYRRSANYLASAIHFVKREMNK